MGKERSTKNSHGQNWHWLTDWYQYRKSTRTFSQRLADDLVTLMGSWRFIIFQTIFLAAWLVLNFYGIVHQWDPYPFVFLNLVVAIQAAYAAPIIMMSQNRQGERDRLQAEADFKTNKAAKKEIEALQIAIARIENDKLAQIIQLLETKKKPSAPKKAPGKKVTKPKATTKR